MPEHTPAPTPSRAVYGFATFLSFKMLFLIYIIWAVIPESYFHSAEITFLPGRYWAVAIPIFIFTAFLFIWLLIAPSLGMCMTPNVDELRTFKDKIGQRLMQENSRKKYSRCKRCSCSVHDSCSMKIYYEENLENCDDKTIPVIKDLDIKQVSELLYLK